MDHNQTYLDECPSDTLNATIEEVAPTDTLSTTTEEVSLIPVVPWRQCLDKLWTIDVDLTTYL